MREGGFGFSNDVLSTSISESRWEVAALLRSHKPPKSSTRHWGFELGEAAQSGHLGTVQKLLDTALAPQAFVSRARTSATTDFEMGDAELEAKVGTMFGALDLALLGRHPRIAIILLRKMIFLLEYQQRKSSASAALDVHAVLICERPDTPFCESAWCESTLYIAILVGYLRMSIATLEDHKHSIESHLALNKLIAPSLPKKLQQIIYLGWPDSIKPSDLAQDRAQEEFNDIAQYKGPLLSEQITPIDEQTYELCEKARVLWKSKRNRKDAFGIFFRGELNDGGGINGERSRMNKASVASILEYLFNIGVDINSLDRAGRTILYWAHVRLFPEIRSRLESLSGNLFASPDLSLGKIRTSILSLLGDLDSSHDASTLGTSALDLSRKWEWDKLGRYLYFSGDADNAIRCFEASAVFDPTVPGNVPAFHYFNCDSCFTEYSYENLLRGMRFVPQGLVNMDLCQACAEVLGRAKVGVPSPDWIKDHRLAHEEEGRAFRAIDETCSEVAVKDKAKVDRKKAAAMELKSKIEGWVRPLKDDWQQEDQREHLERYMKSQEDFKLWLVSDDAEKALTELGKIEKW